MNILNKKTPIEIPEKQLTNCRFLKDRYALLDIVKKNGICAEVGVLAGDFSKKILNKCTPKELVLIDRFNCDDYKGQNRFTAKTNQIYIEAKFEEYVKNNTVKICKGESWKELSMFPDKHFDWIYIDAGHDYNSVKNDITVAGKKVKNDGMIIMNDYIMYDHLAKTEYGVVQATNEFMIENNFEMIYFAFHPQLFCDVVIQKIVD